MENAFSTVPQQLGQTLSMQTEFAHHPVLIQQQQGEQRATATITPENA